MKKTVLNLNNEEAKAFFMSAENYVSFELPEYFDFQPVLDYVKDTIGDKEYEQCLYKTCPETLEKINLEILLNKDGKYAVRPLVISNPYLYYFLVREITDKENWDALRRCFVNYQTESIKACAIPVIPEARENFPHSTSILNWWHEMEQKSIIKSLRYKYMFKTDITNCYGTINPQTVDWALSMKGTSKKTDENKVLSHNIQKYLRALQDGNNNGIPQGSTLFDFIAEIILGYADLLLAERLEKLGIKDYEVIRFRDDYRIFCNEKDILDTISYELQDVLRSLGFSMNSDKTSISNSIVTDSLKKDKLELIRSAPSLESLKGQKKLMYILQYAREYPNTGQLKGLLTKFNDEMIQMKKNTIITEDVFLFEDEYDKAPVEEAKEAAAPQEKSIFAKLKVYGVEPDDYFNEKIQVMVSILIQIALENISISHYAMRVISTLLLKIEDKDVRKELVESVFNCLHNQPNSAYVQIWLQNITYKEDDKNSLFRYSDIPLCEAAAGLRTNSAIWNNSWLNEELVKDFDRIPLCKEEVLAKLKPYIRFKRRVSYDEI